VEHVPGGNNLPVMKSRLPKADSRSGQPGSSIQEQDPGSRGQPHHGRPDALRRGEAIQLRGRGGGGEVTLVSMEPKTRSAG